MLEVSLDPANPDGLAGLRAQMWEKGVEEIRLSPEDIAREKELMESVYDKFIEDLGPLGQELLDIYRGAAK